jgi:hypothetical protein
MISQAHALRGRFPSLKPRLCLILFLVATFFLLCPLWAYLSLCSLSAQHEAGQSCFLYSFVFNMPVSLDAVEGAYQQAVKWLEM